MSATIIVHCGENSGEQHWIEDEVVKIGSGPDCTFVVRGIPSHCLTMLYRSGQYSIVNRCHQAIDVAGEPLLPLTATSIHNGQCVAIGMDTVLRLDIDGDPAPSRRPRSVIDTAEAEPRDLGDERQPNAMQTVRRYAILAVALLAGCYLLFGGSLADRRNDADTIREFHEIVDFLQSNAADSGDGPGRICRALQRARVGELRGDTERAIAYYELAKDMVTEDPHKPGSPSRNLSPSVCNRTYLLVKNRLGAIK
jgi:hypothetical protein